MPTRFSFTTAAEIVFGSGTLQEIGPIAAGLGKKALVVAGTGGTEVERLVTLLASAGVGVERLPVRGEPTVATIQAGTAAARSAGCDLVVGFGGGSALDTGKAVAAMLTNPGDLLDYLEVVGQGRPITERPAPFIAVPTTAGTGSEVTRNAVIGVPEKQVKVSLRSPLLLARVALVDPELTLSLPAEVTASTGMDALVQVIEPYTSRRANPLTDLYCRDGITRASRSLLRAYQDGSNRSAREDMAFTSLMGGLALANAGLGAVHGFAGVIGGRFDAPHGAVCAALLAPVVLVNARALAEREPGHPALLRYAEIARVVTASPNGSVHNLVRWVNELRRAMHMPALGAFGVKQADLEGIVEQSAAASSMKANPIELTKAEMREILEAAL